MKHNALQATNTELFPFSLYRGYKNERI